MAAEKRLKLSVHIPEEILIKYGVNDDWIPASTIGDYDVPRSDKIY